MSWLSKKNGKYILEDVVLPNSAELELEMGESIAVEIKLLDKRQITSKQRNFIFALCREYQYHTGNDAEWFRLLMQQYNANLRDIEVESLSNCSITYANGLIDTIVNFFIENDIPIQKNLLQENEYSFTEKQTYAMVLKRVCVVCGLRADIHHLDTIGMGNDRKEVSHIGKRVLPLCRIHHNEIHNLGNDKFIKKYHLDPIVVDKKMEHFIKKGTLKYYKGE